MSLRLSLKLDNDEYDILEFTYSLKQKTDNAGRPSGAIEFGFIHLVLDAIKPTGFVEKMSDQLHPVNGKIFYYDILSDQKRREVEFSNGYIIFYEENFLSEGTSLCRAKVTISAQHIRIGNEKFSNVWLT